MRISRGIRKAIAWTCLVMMASIAGGLFFAYTYVTDSVTIERMIKSFSPKYLPNSVVSLTRARIRPLTGEVNLHHLSVNQVIDGKAFVTLRIPWLQIGTSFQAALRGKFEPDIVKVALPTLSLRRRSDGTWNLENLLAKPWPGPVMKTPLIKIQNGTIELSDGPVGSHAKAILREVNITVAGVRPGLLHFDGTAKGDSFDRLSVQGTVNIRTGRIEFDGDIARLLMPDPSRSKIPQEFREPLAQLGLSGGEVDMSIDKLVYDPQAKPQWQYDLAGHLRAGDWNCPKMPFPLNGVNGGFAAKNGTITLNGVDGHYGTTVVRVEKARYISSSTRSFATGPPRSSPRSGKIFNQVGASACPPNSFAPARGGRSIAGSWWIAMMSVWFTISFDIHWSIFKDNWFGKEMNSISWICSPFPQEGVRCWPMEQSTIQGLAGWLP